MALGTAKTWMAEDGIREILAEQRLGHEVPAMRGLYAHASDRMRDELPAALEAHWEHALSARAALLPPLPRPAAGHTPSALREAASQSTADPETPRATSAQPVGTWRQARADLPNSSQICRRSHPRSRMRPAPGASDLA